MPIKTNAMPKVVSREEWLDARKKFLEKEKEMTRALDALNAERRRQPVVKVEKIYVFQGEHEKVHLVDMFDGRKQLIIYHLMFQPEWDRACPNCTHWTDEISPAQLRHMHEGDTSFVLVSRAPIEKIVKYKRERGWSIPWYSSYGTDFNFDFHVSFDESIAPIVYNYRTKEEHVKAGTAFYLESPQPFDLHGMSTFIRDGKQVFHASSFYARGPETVGGAHYFLDLTVYGRQQEWEDSPEGWPQEKLDYTATDSTKDPKSVRDDETPSSGGTTCGCDE